MKEHVARDGEALPDAKPAGAVAAGATSALLEALAGIPDAPMPGAGAPRPGDRVGRFEILREIGRGGFGVVYEARDDVLGRAVALKLLRRRGGTEVLERWLIEEAESAAQMQHPNIVSLHDLGLYEGSPFLVFELLRGERLADRLARAPVSPDEALGFALQIARGLAHAHARGVVHRDVKPGNVFVCEDGSVKLLDFGLSRVLGTSGGSRGGTPAYMAPEQWRGEPADARADVFALGVMLHEMLSGKIPYPVGPSGSAVLEPGEPPRLEAKGLPRGLPRLVGRALAKDPRDRPATGGAMLQALLAVGPTAGRTARARWTFAAAVVAVLAVAVATRFLRRAPQLARPRIPVAVADFTNETGERDLDSLSGMLITSLEQSAHLAVLTRSRMFDHLRNMGVEGVDRVDERLGREIGRRGSAKALLVSTIRRFENVYAIEVRAVDPVRDEDLFAMKEQGTGKATVPELVDRISERTRRALDAEDREVSAPRLHVAEATTRSMDAYYHYFAGLQCLDRPAVWVRSPNVCSTEFEKAVEIDPEFALAHYALSRARELEVQPLAHRVAPMGAALRLIDRVPRKERLYMLAWSAHLAEKDEEAHATYRQLLESYPDEKDAVFLAGDVLFHRDEFERASPHFDRLLELDPLNPWGLDHLAFALFARGHLDGLRARIRAWEALPAQPAVLHAISLAQGLLGNHAAAQDAARREIAAGGGGGAEQDLMMARFCGGDQAAVEEEAQRIAAAGGAESLHGLFWLALVRQRQGRLTEALRLVDQRMHEEPSESDVLLLRNVRASLLVARGDAGALGREARWIAERDPMGVGLAIDLAYLGALDEAQEIAKRMRPGSSGDHVYRAVLAWRKGDLAAARDALAAVASRTPLPLERASATAPSIPSVLFYLGEVSLELGDLRGAVDALRRYRATYLPTGWHHLRALYLTALAHERLGELDVAGARAEELVAVLRAADRDLPLRRDALALRDRVLRPTSPSAPPGSGRRR